MAVLAVSHSRRAADFRCHAELWRAPVVMQRARELSASPFAFTFPLQSHFEPPKGFLATSWNLHLLGLKLGTSFLISLATYHWYQSLVRGLFAPKGAIFHFSPKSELLTVNFQQASRGYSKYPRVFCNITKEYFAEFWQLL